MSKLCSILLFCLLILTLFGQESSVGDVRLPYVISENMVLQRDMELPIWGWADAGENITVTIADQTKNTMAGRKGEWEVNLDAMSAGGPYVMTVVGNNQLTLDNILIGEVWICSGQSNMRLSVAACNNAQEESSQANYPEIRFFDVEQTSAYVPSENCFGRWVECSPDSAPAFSAAGYYFGRDLHKRLEVPIGLIHASWDGTAAESWTSRKTLEKLPALKPDIDECFVAMDEIEENVAELRKDYEPKIVAWRESWDELAREEADVKKARIMSDPDLDTSDWGEMTFPTQWEKSGLPGHDGIVWFRKEVEIPQSWAGKGLILHLGPIDEIDVTWFNGTKVGGKGNIKHRVYGYWDIPREYEVSGSIVRPGRNVITIRAADTAKAGGLWQWRAERMIMDVVGGPEEKPVSLAGVWKYKAGTAFSNKPALLFSQGHPCVLYNGMIAPLMPFGIRGVIWYQGEANTGNAPVYQLLLSSLITDWRANWGQGGFSFLIVQLANYAGRNPQPGESSWAEVRDAQLQTSLSLPDTGLAVTIDIGSSGDIHPRNKQDVGKRLALAARSIAYMEDICSSGPIFDSMQIEGNKIRLKFKSVCSGLSAKGGELKGFAIAGVDKNYVWAQAKIHGDTVLVWSDQIPEPTMVKYGWDTNPDCNLYNTENLPASPFRTDSDSALCHR